MTTFNYNGLSKSSGIYVIFNNLNWRIYVGTSKCFQVRWFRHYNSLRLNKHSNKFLQADFNKCKELLGNDDFLEFHIIKPMPNSSREERLLEEEKLIQIHFDQGKNCYNLCDRAISREGFGPKDPEETRTKLSLASRRFWDSKSEEEKRKLTEHLVLAQTPEGHARGVEKRRGRKLSAEHVERLRKCHLGTKLSEEHKANMSKANKGKPWPKARREAYERMKKAGLLKRGRPSEETLKKLRGTMFKKGLVPWNKGKTLKASI